MNWFNPQGRDMNKLKTHCGTGATPREGMVVKNSHDIIGAIEGFDADGDLETEWGTLYLEDCTLLHTPFVVGDAVQIKRGDPNRDKWKDIKPIQNQRDADDANSGAYADKRRHKHKHLRDNPSYKGVGK